MCDEHKKKCVINVYCGDEGHHRKCDCPSAYLNVYSLLAQNLPSGGAALFEVEGANSGDFNTINAPLTGEVEIMKKGVYVLNWSVNGLLAPPYPFPVPAWGFELYLNGVAVLGSGSASCSITPDEIVTNSNGGIILELDVGDKLKLQNICIQAVDMVASPFGLISPITSARMNINLIKELM